MKEDLDRIEFTIPDPPEKVGLKRVYFDKGICFVSKVKFKTETLYIHPDNPPGTPYFANGAIYRRFRLWAFKKVYTLDIRLPGRAIITVKKVDL